MLIDWLDVETTGVDANNDRLLQVSCLVTDLELNLLDEEGFTAEVFYNEEEVRFLKDSSIPYVVNMHNVTGLWDKLPQGKPLEQVDKDLAAYLGQFHGPKEGYLGGNSITLDRNFINANLFKTAEMLHYRSIDVSSFAILADAWYNGLQFEKRYSHDAKDDIKESLEQLKFFRHTLFK